MGVCIVVVIAVVAMVFVHWLLDWRP